LIDGAPKRIDHERNNSRRVHGDADFAAAEISIANEAGFALHGMRGAGGERIAVPEASGDGARVAAGAPCVETPIFWDTQLQARIDELKQGCNCPRTRAKAVLLGGFLATAFTSGGQGAVCPHIPA